MPFAPVRFHFDEVDAFSTPRPLDRELRRFIHREHVVTVDGDGRNAVSLGLLSEVLHRELLFGRRRVGPLVVLADDHEWQPLDGGEVQSLVERAGRRAAIPDVNQSDAWLPAQLESQRDAGHHRDHVPEVRDLTQVAFLEVVEMDVQLAAVGWAVGLGHVLPQDLERLGTHHQQRTEVTNQGREDVLVAATLERIRRRDRLAFLAEGAKQPPDDLGLPVEGDQALFQRPRESQVVIDLEELIGRQDHPGGGGCRRPRRRKGHGPTL